MLQIEDKFQNIVSPFSDNKDVQKASALLVNAESSPPTLSACVLSTYQKKNKKQQYAGNIWLQFRDTRVMTTARIPIAIFLSI